MKSSKIYNNNSVSRRGRARITPEMIRKHVKSCKREKQGFLDRLTTKRLKCFGEISEVQYRVMGLHRSSFTMRLELIANPEQIADGDIYVYCELTRKNLLKPERPMVLDDFSYDYPFDSWDLTVTAKNLFEFPMERVFHHFSERCPEFMEMYYLFRLYSSAENN